MKFVMRVLLELPTDEECLTDKGWEMYTELENQIWKLKRDYGFDEISQIRMPEHYQG